jgi:hypothetical protein
MDPYLEAPSLWPDVHHRLIDVSAEFIGRQTRPRYFTQIEERLYLTDFTDPAADVIVPDLHVREAKADAPFRAPPAALATIEPGIDIEVEWELTIHESLIEISDLQSNRVITILEILSPANKVEGSKGYVSYHDKRERALAAGVNVVEIDLLRFGKSLYADRFERHDYSVVVSRPRQGRKPRRTAWPISLRNRLPTIPVPLKPEDGDVALPLQQVLETAYDRAGYDIRLNYASDPVPLVGERHSRWLDDLLCGRGLRKTT